MADPTPYVVSYSFSGFQATNPASPLPAPDLDNELADVEISIDTIVAAIKDIRRADGALKNQIVTEDSLTVALGQRLGVAYANAYDVAVEDGFVGTVSEWLDSLAATLVVGTVTTSAPGSAAAVTITGTAPDYTLNFTLPRGEQGPAGDGSGDMLISVYDPTAVNGNAFDMANMVEAAGAKILTAAERTALDNLAADLAAKLAAADVATATQYRANTADKVLDTDGVWSAGAVVTLTDATTVAVDMATFLNAQVTIAGNRTLGDPTNTKVGQSGCIKVTASGATRTLSKGANWKSTTSFPISIASGASVHLFYSVFSPTEIIVSVVDGAA